mmetsp:Transcript_60678/g.159537  ORF Transcript_60678/g.159537 Transcript_60678/m.159537 type:complete len:206 (-) Transcript_60678:46-663(-)
MPPPEHDAAPEPLLDQLLPQHLPGGLADRRQGVRRAVPRGHPARLPLRRDRLLGRAQRRAGRHPRLHDDQPDQLREGGEDLVRPRLRQLGVPADPLARDALRRGADRKDRPAAHRHLRREAAAAPARGARGAAAGVAGGGEEQGHREGEAGERPRDPGGRRGPQPRLEPRTPRPSPGRGQGRGSSPGRRQAGAAGAQGRLGRRQH